MSRRKSRKNLASAIIAVMSVAFIAVWQFYLFVTFKNTNGGLDAQGGIEHLWWAIGLGLLACATAFLFFSVFLRYDRNDEMHITSPPPRSRLS
jgi:Kef-type K+ transport system membrane component KefB